MPAPGTLAALKDIFSAVRTVTADTDLLAADIGRLILVDTSAGDIDLNLPRIGGEAASGRSGVGAGGAIAVLVIEASNTLNIASPTPDPDTFNGGQAFSPIAFTGLNDWLIAVSPGGAGIQDWSILASLPGAL